MTFHPQVYRDSNGHHLLVVAKGRTKYRAVVARPKRIALATLPTLRGLVEAQRNGEPYPPRRAASFWLNHDHRPCTKGAKAVLRSLVARRKGAS